MTKAACVILGLAFLVLGILGITGLIPMFKSDPIYVNIGQIILGGFGLLVGIYARQHRKSDQQSIDRSRQTNQNAELQRKENEQYKKENMQREKDSIDRQQQENEQLKEQLDQQKQENEQLRNKI